MTVDADESLVRLARMVREFHDLTAGTTLARVVAALREAEDDRLHAVPALSRAVPYDLCGEPVRLLEAPGKKRGSQRARPARCGCSYGPPQTESSFC